MNDNILNDLFYGKIDPWEERPTKGSCREFETVE